MMKSACLFEENTMSDDFSVKSDAYENSDSSDNDSTELIAQLYLEKYCDDISDLSSDDSNLQLSSSSQRGNSRETVKQYQKFITRKGSSGVRCISAPHCISPRNGLARKVSRGPLPKRTEFERMNYGKGVIPVCRRRCKSSELRHTGKVCSCSSGQHECLCSVCVASEYGRHKNRMEIKQTKTDYPTDKLKRKLSSNVYTTTTTIKNKQSYHNQTASPRNNSLTSDLYDITECLISESVRDNLLLNKSDAELHRESPINNEEVNQLIQCSNAIIDEAKNLNDLDNKLSAWANWLLEKEKQKRKQKKEAQKKQAEEAQKRNQLIAQKLNRRKIAEEKCKEWIQVKQKEMAQMKKKKEIEKKEKEVKKLQELLERTEKSRLKYEEWCKRKHEEKDRQIGYAKQIEMSRQLANRSRQEASNAAYMEWLKANGNKKCLQYYSHGYSDGKLIDYYDRTANPPPSFINPNPWINPTETTSVSMIKDMNERLECTLDGGVLLKKRTSSKTTTTTTTPTTTTTTTTTTTYTV